MRRPSIFLNFNECYNVCMSHKISVAVLRGGPSSEYDVSLKSGASVLKHLSEKYTAHDILIDKAGVWHRGGVPKLPAKALHNIDVVFNAMHGEFGEDGKVQQILDSLNVPYTGSRALASALGMNKALSKKTFIDADILTPDSIVVDSPKDIEGDVEEILKTFDLPVVVKPNAAGSSVGVSIARDRKSLLAGIKEAFKYGKQVLVEQYIEGREATCGVIENFRGEDVYTLLPVEIVPQKKQEFFDFNAKYSDTEGASEICPGNFDQKTTEMIQNMAAAAHKALGLRHYSRSDFIVTTKAVYILETNTLPGLTAQSLLPKSLVAVGATFSQFLDHLISLALKRK